MLSEQDKQVLASIDENKQEIAEYLSELITFKTVTPPAGGRAGDDEFKKFQASICEILEAMSFDLDVWEVDSGSLQRFPGSGVKPDRDLSDMPVVVGKLEGAGYGKSLILNGHYDVVPPGIIESWSHHPFAGEIRDGKVFGRGACDMKGGIAAMLHAVRFIQEAGLRLSGDLTIEIVPDEESSCMGTLSCCQRGYTADAAIIPEPTDMKVLVAMRGSLYGKITVLGRAGHAEMTQPHWSEGGAVNAILKAAKVIGALEELTEQWRTRPDKQHIFLDPDIVVPTVIKGGEWTVTHPEKVEISFGSMFIPGTANKREEIQAQLMRVAALDPWMREHPPQLDTGEWFYGAEVDENEPIVRTGLKVLEDLGIKPDLTGFGSLTDAIHLINYSKIPTVSIGPNCKSAHMTDEHVAIEELVNTTKALALAIMRWCEVQV